MEEIIVDVYDYESVTVSTVAISLTKDKFNPADGRPASGAYITVENASCRFRCDGTAPTSTEGHQLSAGDTVMIYGNNNLRYFQAIRDTGVDAMLRVSYIQ